MASTTNFGSLMGGWQNKVSQVQGEWASKLDDHIEAVEQTLNKKREILKTKDKELNVRAKKLEEDGQKLNAREIKLEEELKKLARREEAFEIFVKEEEERLEKKRDDYEKKLKSDKNLEKTIASLKIENVALQDQITELTSFQQALQCQNDELKAAASGKDAAATKRELHLNKREIELEQKEEELKLMDEKTREREAELERKEKSLRSEKKKLQEKEAEIGKKEGEFEGTMEKLRFHESCILQKEKEVEGKIKEFGLEKGGVPVWRPAEEYATALANEHASTDRDDQLRTKRSLKILKCAAGKGKGDYTLAFACTPRRIYEAKLAYHYGPPVNVIEVLAAGSGDSPLEAVWNSCKAVQKKLLNFPTDSRSQLTSTAA